MISSKRLVELIRREATKVFETNKVKIQYATIDPDHSSGRPRLLFDGESNLTIKRYAYISTYTPQANDRVMVISGVVQGKVL